MSDPQTTLNENREGLYLYQDGELIPVHTGGDTNTHLLKSYLWDWDIDNIEVDR